MWAPPFLYNPEQLLDLLLAPFSHLYNRDEHSAYLERLFCRLQGLVLAATEHKHWHQQALACLWVQGLLQGQPSLTVHVGLLTLLGPFWANKLQTKVQKKNKYIPAISLNKDIVCVIFSIFMTFILYGCVHIRVDTSTSQCTRGIQTITCRVSFLSPSCGFQALTVVGLGSKCLYLNGLASPTVSIYEQGW